jgi:heme peroxidase
MHTNCLAPSRRQASADGLTFSSYARLFPDLPRFSADDAFLVALGGAGGLCDCRMDVDDEASLGNEAAGWPFFGQFVAHDITADRSAIRRGVDPRELRNERSAQLNLEPLYGDGPVGHPFLFERENPAKLLLGAHGSDVQRNAEGTAIIGDPRNDSHVLISQMHVAFARAHNAFVDQALADHIPDDQIFGVAARELRWHYQLVVTREFLPRLVGDELARLVVAGDRRVYRPNGIAYIPLEFADAAYRYGHSQIRHRYRVNASTPPVPLFPDLLGFKPVAATHRVDWAQLFDFPGQPSAQRAKRIDGRLAGSLIALPLAVTGACETEDLHSLAVRDLERGQGVGLPSGEDVASALGEQPLTREEIGVATVGWQGQTPLWYYLLREAAVRQNGDRLGPVGGRLVAEVLTGLLADDPTSVLYAPLDWRPKATLAGLLTQNISTG